jgi:hypothetical protein
MGFNNTTVVFPSPSPLFSPSPSPSVNVTLINITTNELPLAVRIDDPAFPSLMVQWVAILCFTTLLCLGSVPSAIGVIVQIVLNLVLRILNLGKTSGKAASCNRFSSSAFSCFWHRPKARLSNPTCSCSLLLTA